jgi:regulator of sirC expression with transglutaminase-like and TPR domain
VDLLVRAIEDNDVEVAAIAAAEADPDTVCAELDAIAAELGRPRLPAFLRSFYGELGFYAPDDYDDPAVHSLDRVVKTRAGSPVALAVVLIGVARRVGIALEPIAFPGHFLARAGEALIDPCTGAMPIPREPFFELAARELAIDRDAVEALIVPASARAVATRVLENLQLAYAARGDRLRALLANERLSSIGGPEAAARRAIASVMNSLLGPKRAAPRITVSPGSMSFRIDGGPTVDLSRRRALPLLLARLVDHHQRGGRHGLSWSVLVEAGWPGEKMSADAAWARLRTAIRTLRKLGLADVLLTIGSGYLLDPRCELRVGRDG